MKAIRPYEGFEKYVFVSYSHLDKELVYPYIQMMMEDGYRIWYDEGIHPGTEWSEIIAEKLSECTHFLVFVTENSLNSHNCKRELNYAVHKNKDITPLFMDEAKMSAGMEMVISSLQGVFRKSYNSDEKFLKRIYEAEGMDLCIADENDTDKPAMVADSEDMNSKMDRLVRERIKTENDTKVLSKSPGKLKWINTKSIIIVAITIIILLTGLFLWKQANSVKDILGLNKEIVMYVGESISPEYEIIPSKYTFEDIELILNEEEIVSIDKKGKITAESEGEVCLTMKVKDYTETVMIIVESKESDASGEQHFQYYRPENSNSYHSKPKQTVETETSTVVDKTENTEIETTEQETEDVVITQENTESVLSEDEE